MTETIRQLHERKSTRAFTDEPITAPEREAILHAAAAAPTAGNQQLYTILDIDDPALREKLVDTCDHQPFIAKAPLVLIFCADCLKWQRIYLEAGLTPRAPGAGDLMLAVCDAAIAAQNAVAAAHSLGLGSCYIGDIMENCEAQRELLGLPEYVFPAVMLLFGHPTEQQKERQKPARMALEHIVHKNTYRELPGDELRQMILPRCGLQSYEDWVGAFMNRKYNSDFSREMTRSVEEYLRQFGMERKPY
ncbi:MAG: nitroreductase family protein [Clostridia bacterium]|nr:nitroreductase family protein [Clostridia bacterium]